MRRRQAFGFEGAAFFLQSDSSNSDEGYFGGRDMEENPQDMGRGRGRGRHRGRARGRYPQDNVRGGHQGQGQNLNQGNAPNLNQNQGNIPGVNLAQGHNVNANLPVYIPQGQDQQFNRGNAPNVNPGQFHQMNLVNVHAAGQGQIHAINAGQGQNVNLNQGDIPNINQGQYQHANQAQFVNQGNFPGANLAQGHYVHQGNVPYVHQDTGPRANRPVYYPQGQIQQLNRGNSQNANPGQFQQINPINVPAAGQGQVNAINPGQGQDQDQLANLANVPSISHGQGHRINRSNPPHIIPSLNQHLNPSNPPAIAQGQMNAFNPISISHGGQFHDVNQGYNPYGQVANFGNLSIASADQYVNMPHMLSVNTSQSQDVNRYPNENKGGSRCNDMGNSSNTHSGQEQPVNPRNVPTTSQGQNFHIQNVHPYHVQETDPNFFRTHDFLPRRGGGSTPFRGNHNILGLQHVAYGDGPANMPPGAQGLHNLGLNAPGVIRSISSEGSRDSRQEEGMGDDALGAAGGSPLNRGGGLIVGGENMGGPSYDFVNRGHRRNIYCNRGNRTDRSASVRGHSRPSFAAARTRRLSENADVKRKKSETASASSNKNDPSTSGRSDDTREISKDNKCTKNKAQATPAGDGDEDPAKSQRETVTSKTRGSDENSGNDSNNSGDDTSGGNEGSNESDNSNDNKSDQSGWVRDGARGDRARRRSGGNKSSKISGKVRNSATDGSHVIDGSVSSGGGGDSGVKSGSKGCGGSAVTGGDGGSDGSDSSGGKDGKGSNGGNGGSGSSGSGGSVGDNGGGSDGKGGNGGSGGNGSNGGNGDRGGCSGGGGNGSSGGGNGSSGGSGGCSGGSGSGGGGGRSGGNGGNRNSGGSGSSGNSGSSGSGRSSGNGNRDDSGGATGEGDAVGNRRECDNKSDSIADSMKSDKSIINDITSSGNDEDKLDRTGGQDESGDSGDSNGRNSEGCDSTDSCYKNQQNSHSSSAGVAIGTGSNNSKGHSVGKGSKENLKDRSGNTVDNNKIDTVSDEGSSGSTRRLATGGTGESRPGIGDIDTVEGKGNEGGTSNSKSTGDVCDSKNVTGEGGVFQDFSQEGNVARFQESDKASGDPHNDSYPPPFPVTYTDVHSNLTVPMDPNVLPAGFVLKTDPGVSNSEACFGSENTQSGLEEGNPNTASESGLVCDEAKSSSSTGKTQPRFTYYNGMLINLDLAHMPADNFSNFSQANPFSGDVLTQMNIPPPVPESMVQSFNACVPTYPSIENSQLLPSPQRGLYSLVNENTQYHIDTSARSMEPVQQYTIIGAPTYPSQIGAQFLPSSQSRHEHIQFTPGVGAEGQVLNVPLYPATNNTQILSLPQFGHQSVSNANIPSQFNVPPPGMENVLPSFNNVIPRHISSNNNPHFFTSPQSGSQLSATAEIPHFNFGPRSAENAIKQQFYKGVPLYQIAHNTQLPSSLVGNQQSPVSVPHTSFPNAMSSSGFNLAPSMKNVQPNLGNVLHPRLSKAIVNIDFNRPPIRPMNVSNRDIDSNITVNDNDTENSSTPSCITLPPRQGEESSETLATPETAVQTVVDKLVEQYGRPCVYHALSKNASDKSLPSLPTEVLQAIPGDPSSQRSVIMPPVTEAMSEPQPISTLEVPEITQIGSISDSCSTPQCSDQAGGVQQSEMSSFISSGDKHSLPAEKSGSGCGAHSNIVGVNQYSSTLSPKKALYGSKPIPAGRGYGKAPSPRKNRGGNRPIVSHAPTRFQEGKVNAHRGHNISDANVQVPIKEVSIADTHVALVCNDKGDGVSDNNVQLKSTDLAPYEDKTSDDSLVSVSKQVSGNAEHSKEKEKPQVKVSNVPSVGVKRFKESFPLKVECDFKSDITFGSFDEDVSNQEKTENKGDKKRKEVCSKQDEEGKIGGEDYVKENTELNLNCTKMLSEDRETSPIKGDKSSLVGDSNDSLHMSITKQVQSKEMQAISCKEQKVVDTHKNKCTGTSVEKKCGKGTWGKDHSSGGEASKIYIAENQKTGVSTGFMSAPSEEDFPALPSYGDRKKLVDDSTTKASIPPRRPVGVGAYAKSNNRFFPYIEEKTGKDKINRKEHETNKDGYVDNMKRLMRPKLTLGGPYTNLLTVDTPSTCVGNDDSDLCVNFYLNLEHEFLGFISADSEDDYIPLQSDEDRNSGVWSEDESFDQFPLPSPSFHSDAHGDTITELASDGVHPEDKAPDSREENDSVARSLPFEGILQGNKDSIKELEQEQATHETGSAGLCESNLDLEKDNHHKHTAHLRNTLKLMTNKRDDDVGSGAANKGERLDAEDLNRLPQAAGFSGAGGLDRLRKFLAEHDVGGAGDEQNTVHGGEAGAVEDYLFRVSSSNPSNPS